MEVNRATISSGSVGTFRSHTTLPVSSTTHTAVSFTETSRPTKYAIAIAPSSLLEVTVTPIWSSHVEGLRSTYSATQPPRYTILLPLRTPKRLVRFRPTPVKSRPSSRVAWCEIHRLATAVTGDRASLGAGSPTRLYTARCCRIDRRLSSCAQIMPLQGERELGL